MKINQYFITNDDHVSLDDSDFSEFHVDDFKIFVHKNLKANQFSSGSNKLVILGDAFNPFNPEFSNERIGKELVQANFLDEFLKNLDKITGRYVMFLCIDGSYYVLSDFFGQRQVYYWFDANCFYASSSPKLILETLKLDLEIDEIKLALSKSNYFLKIHEHWLLGETDWDSRLKKILPNHYLNINQKTAKRIPMYVTKTLNNEGLEQEALSILKNSMEAYSKRYSIMLGITSGYDSRLLLASSITLKNTIKYFTFNRKDTYVKRDIKIARQLAEAYHLDYKSIDTSALSLEFISEYKNQFIIPRILDKTKNIQWFKNQNLKNTAVVSGNGGPIIKRIYKEEDFATANSICKATKIEPSKFNISAIDQWLETAKEYTKEHSLLISDLFYLEMKFGKWGSKMSHEIDFAAVENFTPYNNRHLAFSLLLYYNKGNHKTITLSLLEKSLEGITTIPFNPKTWKDTIKKIIFYEYYKKWIQRIK